MREREHQRNVVEGIDRKRYIERHIAERLPHYGGRCRSRIFKWIHPAVAAPAVFRCSGEHRDAQKQTLLKNQHHDTRNDERCETLLRIAEEIGFCTYRGTIAYGEPEGIDGFLTQIGVGGHLQLRERREESAVAQQQTDVAVEMHESLLPAPHTLRIAGWNIYHPETFLFGPPASGLLDVGGVAAYLHCLGGVGVAHELARERRTVGIDNRNGHVARNLRIVDQGVYDGVNQRKSEEKQHDARVAEHHSEFPPENMGCVRKPFHKLFL